MIHTKLKTRSILAVALALAGAASHAPAQTAPNSQTTAGTVVADRRPAAPQVVTVVHRLNGIKVLRLLLRSGEVGAVDTVDEAFRMTSEVHTNIIAGLALDDGETIAVLLPEAEVEVDAWGPFAPPTPPLLPGATAPPESATPASVQLTADFAVTPELTIIGRDGKRHPAQYIGLDGITGLSLLKLSDKNLPAPAGIHEAAVALKQHVRLFSPEAAPDNRASASRTISVRIGETSGTIVGLRRGFDGKVSRIKMISVRLSAANVGGVAIGDAGQTVGIVASIEKSEAVILPPAVIRGAAERVLARKGSVPRPWLGVSGESVAFTPLEGIVQRGWEPARALSLIRNQSGILLTAITPGSPAEIAALRAGDVIVRVNNSEIKNTDDFSMLLETAGESPVRFTIVRPNHPEPESVTVRLSEPMTQAFTLRQVPAFGPQARVFNPLIRQGIETMPLGPAAAARLNSSGGLLVVFVQSQTPAAAAGLRPTDVIEAINGQPVLRTAVQAFQELTGGSYTLNVVRDKQKLVLTVELATP